ncbi:MAG: molecular chaperone HtpG, partial [Lachnospiraceae bacterium]|nr:molecular chaperone HtpG [Lachnospiraceae bacterium]
LDALTETFRTALGKENLNVKVEKLKDTSVASVITLSEEGRRMQDMMKMYNYGMDASMFAGDETLTLNISNPLVTYILENKDGEHVPVFCKQLYDLAMLSNQPLAPEAMTDFVARSNEIMLILANQGK